VQLNYVIDSASEAVRPTDCRRLPPRDLCHLDDNDDNDDDDDVWQTLLQLEQDVHRRLQRCSQYQSSSS